MRKRTGVKLVVLLVVLAVSFLAGGLPGQANEACCSCGPQFCQAACYQQCNPSDQACLGACDDSCYAAMYQCISSCPWPIC